jgi:hypothetical protein
MMKQIHVQEICELLKFKYDNETSTHNHRRDDLHIGAVVGGEVDNGVVLRDSESLTKAASSLLNFSSLMLICFSLDINCSTTPVNIHSSNY